MSSTGVIAPEIEGEFAVEDNPYFDQHVQAEIDYLPVRSREARRKAVELVKDEFRRSGCHRPRRCPCGKQMWWRATVSAYVCTNFGARSHMAHWNGEMLRSSLELIEQEKK